ncbi:ABC-2 family transporter protein [Dactylosporangium roseum]|uniref:ABC-2 family transporter protein n=1 Tax=Dactylosporangium roseum TaxID=47989 RepID=A0ABY5ZD98_9ACTN|nr:ABC-2 family transporter protein [Dactylosporangium roseum]UWZ39397.1 ABC-2 family transporter protein [Dactylosporangium roseum]
MTTGTVTEVGAPRPAEEAGHHLQVFTTLVGLEIKRIFRYPSGPLFSLLVDPFVVLAMVFMIHALYRNNGGADIVGYSLHTMIWYFVAATITRYLVSNDTDWRVSDRIMRGELAQDLVRPLSVITWELAAAVAARLTGIVLEFLPSVLIYSLIDFPAFLRPAAVARFLAAATIAFVLYFAVNFIVGMTTLYLQGPYVVLAIRFVVLSVGAGAFVPLEFLPGPVQQFLNWSPLPYLFYWPIQFLLGRPGAADWGLFLRQESKAAAWAVILLALTAWMWRRAIRRYTDAGV